MYSAQIGMEAHVRYYRKVIHICAEDSPNVRLGLLQERQGTRPTHELLTPGVLSYDDYKKRRATWDKVRQCIGLDGRFYKGSELLLFPKDWLDLSHELWTGLRHKKRVATGIGIDPAEGGDRTAMAAVDEYGLIELISKKTPDTNKVATEAVAFIKYHNVSPDRVCFDRGGGGKEHADRLRAMGYPVRTVAFGEAISLDPRRGLYPTETRRDTKEERYTYVNRRAQMYGDMSELFDPSIGPGFALPDGFEGPQYAELRRQLAPLPKLYDGESRLYLPPKNKKNPDSKEITLKDMLGCSPDEADAVALACHARLHKGKVIVIAGAV